jgi:ubiquinone/menaquinone biosynthesis C-methylase UbiE
MKLSRNLTIVISYILDNLIPAVLRDQKWFMWIPFKIMFKDKADVFFNFKDDVIKMTDEQLADVYRITSDVHISRETDLNTGCIEKIKKEVVGQTVLEVGCGTGYLMSLLEEKYQVTGVDFNIDSSFEFKNPKTKLLEHSATQLPFKDNEFETVICTHTLEHVKNIGQAIKELKRVCSKKLIVVVPKQRPYKYTFDLHIHFFPYAHTFETMMQTTHKPFNQRYSEVIQGDIYYHEQY